MGARLYLPHAGTFTSLDPVEGGNTTAFTYPQDPVNSQDLDGMRRIRSGGSGICRCGAKPGRGGLSLRGGSGIGTQRPGARATRARGVAASQGLPLKARARAVGLPVSGLMRYVPPRGMATLPRGPRNGYIDRLGNEWVKGPSRTQGDPYEWDVQLSARAIATFGSRLKWLSRDGKHLNVSLGGRITHKGLGSAGVALMPIAFGVEIRTIVKIHDIPSRSLGVVLGVGNLGQGEYEYAIGIYGHHEVVGMRPWQFELTGRENVDWE